ncbi:TRAP transporter substrate-binding protein DctP [Altererythrobacter sp.]|uniref:TRAP transporter substrate-binding protein DctP n=1 Tax=Altererythrobacter sp. TaxID=1872480 RepID=UPI003D108C0D
MIRLAAFWILLLLAGCSRPLPEGVTELTYATPYPPSHPFSRADQRWIDYVAKASGGSLRIRPIWSGALLSSDMSMEELRHGVADIGLITPIYTRGSTHLIRTQSGFYSGAESFESQVALYHCIEAGDPQVNRELEGLKVLAVQGGLLPGVLTRDIPVRSLSDLRGLRLRAPTELLSVLDDLGADPVNMPMADVYSALAKGVIDGVIAPVDTLKVLHFAEVAKYYNTLKVPRGAYPSRAIGERRWNELTDAQRSILTEGIPVWEAALAEEVQIGAEQGRAAAADGGVEMFDMPQQDQIRFEKLYLRDAERNAQRLERYGIDGLAAFRIARSSVVARNQIECGGRE